MTDAKHPTPDNSSEHVNVEPEDIRSKPEPAKNASIGQGGVSFLTAAVIAMAFSAFSSFLSYHYATVNQPASAQIVLVDGSKLANAQMKQTLDKPGMTPEQAQADGLAFVNELQDALKPYSEAGVLVVNSSVVMNIPDGLNITKQVAQRLGLTLE
ncbi:MULTISPECIES: hypothetical protein [unclassified Pseudomonas]|uniref:hypothetical protein n=1 Tax=unclassified Pseudomonas TaxID=196821 RepID=UPI000C87CD90|nr:MULTISPECIES: hypothetical protein [unclassified Pseudomonas]PMW40062.1 hypothetical protein C1X45_08275 [Pseudomonas sp. GW460-7]PMW41173.1 hypothetical protein C1X48_06910 [Pseudomonas sp. FW305-3-2-15-A-R2A1]PMW62766.1 hypothetical protein C1X39_03895 [Pseudomonas sp. GW456-12-1-14-TSB1]PMY23069.1 hypothetical protein C1X54_06010 [Pseudomonas sp. GW460-13]